MVSEITVFLGSLPQSRPARFAIFLSGSGSNAEHLLEDPEVRAAARPVALVTDAPERSRASEIGRRFDLPVAALDIREFYRSHGAASTSLATVAGRELRLRWTDELRRLLLPFQLDFGVLAGFESLCNIAADLPCLNIHPGDLSVVDDAGRRMLVGLHTKPIETALLAGFPALRSSVILASPYTGSGGDMDNGLLLGISAPVPVEWAGRTPAMLRAIQAARPPRRPAGGWGDELFAFARSEQERLKQFGDYRLFPRVVRDFALRRFARRGDELFYRRLESEPFRSAGVLEYGDDGCARSRQ